MGGSQSWIFWAIFAEVSCAAQRCFTALFVQHFDSCLLLVELGVAGVSPQKSFHTYQTHPWWPLLQYVSRPPSPAIYNHSSPPRTTSCGSSRFWHQSCGMYLQHGPSWYPQLSISESVVPGGSWIQEAHMMPWEVSALHPSQVITPRVS